MSHELIHRVELWHGEACEELWQVAQRFGLKADERPSINFTTTGASTRAFYRPNTHACYYDLADMNIVGEQYRSTVFHEVAHGYARLIGFRGRPARRPVAEADGRGRTITQGDVSHATARRGPPSNEQDVAMKTWRGAQRRYAHAKLDGHFVSVCKNVMDDIVCRSSQFTPLDLSFVPQLYAVQTRVPSGTTLHGELFVPGRPASHVKTAIKERNQDLQIVVHSVPSMHDGTPLPEVAAFVKLWGLPFAPYRVLSDVFRAEHAMQWAVNNGYEGLVFKDGNSFNCEKWKPTRTIDLIVTDTVDGEGKYLGLVGALVCSTIEGHVVANVSGMDDLTRAQMTLDDGLIGRIVEVEYQYVGSRGRLRHPRFKRFRCDTDKARSRCNLDQDPQLREAWS